MSSFGSCATIASTNFAPRPFVDTPAVKTMSGISECRIRTSDARVECVDVSRARRTRDNIDTSRWSCNSIHVMISVTCITTLLLICALKISAASSTVVATTELGIATPAPMRMLGGLCWLG
jgi:hypothetical protein